MPAREPILAPVVFADRFYMAPEALAEIENLGGYIWADARDEEDLAAQINGSTCVRVIVSEYIRINAAVLKSAPGIKGLIAYGAGFDHLDLQAARDFGVQACNCRGENAQAVAELAFGLLLALQRRIHRADRWMRENEWPAAGRALPEWIMGRELWRKKLGIIGLGQIGARVARIGQGFEMKVMAYDPFVQAKNEVECAPLDELLAWAEILSLHVPLNAQTEKMIGARELGLLRADTILINSSRGGVVDEQALLEALQKGRIQGAALDVFYKEPLSGEHPLAKLENVVLSPHMGAMTQEAGDRLSAAVARQARDIMEGRKPECLIQILNPKS